MAHTYRAVRQTVVRNDADDLDTVDRVDYGVSVAERVVYLIGGIIMSLLAVRFVLSLLGANRANWFADLIYTLSHPFAAPFFGLFNYREQFGIARFEFETLVAIAFWAFMTWLVARLVTIGRRREY